MWLQAERTPPGGGAAAPRREPGGRATRDAPTDRRAAGRRAAPRRPAPRAPQAYRSPEEVGDDELLAALRANRWRVQRAAAQLGISRTSLYDRIESSQRIRKAADL